MTDRTKAMDALIAQDADLIDKLRDEDSYYRIQEKHWCIDAEELERQRLAAADEIERLRKRLEIPQPPFGNYDGIACRDETIRLLDAQLAKWKALAETLAGALQSYAEYCDICHGRGSIIEEDSATGADLWRDCPGCGPATDALTSYKEQRNA